MRTTQMNLKLSRPLEAGKRQAPEIAFASVPDTLAALHVNPIAGSRTRRGHPPEGTWYNEVAEQKGTRP